MTDIPAAQVLHDAIAAYLATKWHGGPIPSPHDRALARVAQIPFPQQKPGWPLDTGEDAPNA